MLKLDRDAFVCDMAETYHIFDWRAHPVSLISTLACGLGDNSRIRRKASGLKVETNTLYLAAIVDRLSLLVWAQTEDARKGRNRPEMLVRRLVEHDDDAASLSIEEFERIRQSKTNEEGGRIWPN